MSTREYLNNLSYAQLVYARSVADSLIAKMDDEKGVKIWVIGDGTLNHAAFPEADIQAAKDKLVELIQSGEMVSISNVLFKFEIRLVTFREGEAAEMLEL